MSRYDTSALTRTDLAALGLGDNSPCDVVEASGRAACSSEWSRIQGAISPNTAGTNPDGTQLAALNQERAVLQAAINQLIERRPDLRSRAPASLTQLQPGEPGYNGQAATLQGIRLITRRLRRLLAVLAGLAAATAPEGGGGGGGGGGSSGGGGGSAVTPAVEVAALNAARGTLQQQINAALDARPDLRTSAPAALMREQPDEFPRGTLPTLRATVARLRALVQWLGSQPSASSGPGGYASIMPQPSRSVTAADFGDQWGSSSAPAPETYQVAFFGGETGRSYAAQPWATAASVGPQWGSSALPCGLGSWLSDAFRSVTGQRLSDSLPGLVSGIPVVGGIASSILSSINSGSQGAQAAAAVAAAGAAGGPCGSITDTARRAACQLAMAQAIDDIRRGWNGASAAQPCAHLPAAQRVQCQGQMRMASDAVRAAYATATPSSSPIASLTLGPTTDADRAAVAQSSRSTSGGIGIMPIALGAAALLLFMGGRR